MAQKDVSLNDILFMENELEDFKGGMAENYVQNSLVRSGLKTYFWRNDKGTKEVDFIINLDGKLIPLEVKSGENTEADSLKDYVRLFKPDFSIRVSEKNFGFDNNIKSVPLYAVFCIK
jgi:predicted AAA+ superfamily ATPase